MKMGEEIPADVIARLEEMAKKVEEARRAYEEEARKIAEQHADAVKALEADIAELQKQLEEKKNMLKLLKKTRIAGVKVGGYQARVPGGKADVLKWMKENLSVGDEISYSDLCKQSGYHKSNVYGALVAAMQEGWVEKTGPGRYKIVGEIQV